MGGAVMKTTVRLVRDMQFIGISESGHAVVMDAPHSSGGHNTAAKPSELLLMAFGGCSGMDVISILRKKQQRVSDLEINITGEVSEDHPKMFTDIHIEYVVRGKNISEEAVKRSIELSLGKYCMVGSTIGKAAKITHSYRIEEEK